MSRDIAASETLNARPTRGECIVWGLLVATQVFFIHSRWVEEVWARRPIIDSLYYLELAQLWLHGQLTPPDHGLLLLAPGYSIFLMVILPFCDTTFWIIYVAQAAIGSAALIVLARLMRDMTNRVAAVIATALVFFYGPYQLFTASLLSEALIFPVIVGFFWLYEQNRWPALQVILLGYAYLLRPNLGLFVVALLLWLLLTDRRRFARLGWVLLFLLIIPAFHWITAGRPAGGSAQASVALYLGNHPGAHGLFTNSLGLRGDMHQLAEQVIVVTERETGRKLETHEVNRYWSDRVLQWAREQPGAFANNVVTKSLRLIDTHEYATDHQWLSDHPSAARWFPVPFAVIIALAAAGVWRSLNTRWAPYLLYLATGVGGLLIFYPSSRHRFILLPVLVIFAARGVFLIARRSIPACALAVTVLTVSLIGVPDERRTADPFVLFNHAVTAHEAEDEATAQFFLDRSLKTRPDVAFFYSLEAELRRQSGNRRGERGSRLMAFLLGETDVAVINAVAADALDNRHWSFAERVFRRALELYPKSAATQMNLAQVLLAQNKHREASAAYTAAVSQGAKRRRDLELLLADSSVLAKPVEP